MTPVLDLAAAARLLAAIPHADDRVSLVAAALADAETAALDPVLALADDCERWARSNEDLARRFADQGDADSQNFHAGLRQAWYSAAERIRQAAGGGR